MDSPAGSLRDALILVAIAAAACAFFVRPIIRTWIARKWPHATGTVTSAEVISGGDSDGRSNKCNQVIVTYRYKVDGAEHTGNRYSCTCLVSRAY